MEKEQLTLFFVKWFGYSLDAAMDFVAATPNLAYEMAEKLKNELLKDEHISSEKKEELKQDFTQIELSHSQNLC